MNNTTFAVIAGLLSAVLTLHTDLHRRRLTFARAQGWRLLTALDLPGPAITLGLSATLVVKLIPVLVSKRVLPLNSPLTWSIVATFLIFAVIWREGGRQVKYQRPSGIVFGEWLILAGAYELFREWTIFGGSAGSVSATREVAVLCGLGILSGAVLVIATVVPFVKKYEGHRIIDRVTEQGESAQPEYTPPTWECPHPERWQMLDAQTSEVEVLDFLKSLVITVKPHLIVETGTFLANATIKMAEGLRSNGFGRIITIESDPDIFAEAKQRIDRSALGQWIECRNESSFETRIDGNIDILYSDSKLATREKEIRRFLPQVDPRGLILIHDASSHFRIVRDAALRMEQEGLISTVLLPTPRGLVIAQAREGRK